MKISVKNLISLSLLNLYPFLICLTAQIRADNLLILFLFYMNILLSSFGVITNNKYLASLFYWIFVYAMLLVPGIMQYLTGVYPWGGKYDESIVVLTLLMLLLCNVLFYWINYKKNSVEIKLGTEYIFKKINFIAITLLLVSVAYFLVFKIIGIQYFFIGRNLYTQHMSDAFSPSVGLIVTSFARVIPFIIIAFLLYCFRENRVLIKNPYFLLLLFISIPILFVTTNPIVSARFWLATVFLTHAYILNSAFFKTWYFPHLFIVSFIFIFPMLDVFRYGTEVDNLQFVSDLSLQLTTNGDFDSFQQILNSILYTFNSTLLWGENILVAFLFFIPRSIWVEKLHHSGILVAQNAGLNYENLSLPLWGEFIISFGLLMPLFFILFAFLIKKIDQTNHLNPKYVITTFFSFYLFISLRGSLLTAVSFLFPVLMVFLIYRFMCFSKVQIKHLAKSID